MLSDLRGVAIRENMIYESIWKWPSPSPSRTCLCSEQPNLWSPHTPLPHVLFCSYTNAVFRTTLLTNFDMSAHIQDLINVQLDKLLL